MRSPRLPSPDTRLGDGQNINRQLLSGVSEEVSSDVPRSPEGDVYAWPGSPAPPAAQGIDDRPGSALSHARRALDQAETLRRQGRYALAITQGEEALQDLESTPEHDRLTLARNLSLLGELHWLRGDFASAESLLLRAKAIHEAGLVANHPEVVALLGKLGILYQAQGLYGRAEPLHQRALRVQEAMLGREHVDVAGSLNNLAILYKAQGLYDRAEPLLQRALAIRQAALGENHPDIAFTLVNLAILYEAQGLHDRAEPLLQRALRIQEAALGPSHPDVAFSLDALAALSKAQGRYSEAEMLARSGLAIREAALGPTHPLVASSLHEMSTLYFERGWYLQAEDLARRALAIREAALGESHPDVAASLTEIALLHVAQGRLGEAVPLFTRAFSLSEQRLRREALDFSESRLAGFLQYLRADEERLYALLRAYPGDAGVRRLALTAALLRKGRSAQEIANTSRVVYRSLGPDDRETFARLRELRSRLARLSLEGKGSLVREDYQRQVRDLAEQGDVLEARLAKRSARLRALTELPSSADVVDQVAAALSPGRALVELIAYTDRPLVPAPGPPESRLPGQLRYLALVLFPDARIEVLDLGPLGPIDEAATRLRDALAIRSHRYQAVAEALHALVFRPLRPLLGNTRNLYLSPDGQLSLVPFAAVHDGRHFLGDTFTFTYLTSGKDLLPGAPDLSPPGPEVVFAAPDFDAVLEEKVASADGQLALVERSYSSERSASPLRFDPAERHRWVPLPGTRREAEALQRFFPQAQIFVGPDATKGRLLRVSAPSILHIATHGFFLDDAAMPSGARAVVSTSSVASRAPLPSSANPLLRSGLVLAGAAAAAATDSSAGMDRTLVTALELAGLDLWGTQLVVLSACDTGRGDVKLGQGVYGLRRALVVAGAETVVMSLWKVNDETTRTLMESFYRNLLDGQGRTAALRGAMQELRRKQPHPYYWAPFISLGRDAPLKARTGG